MRETVVGLGAGGHAKVLIEIVRAGQLFDVVGLLDPDPRLQGESVLGVPVLGDDSLLPELIKQGTRHFFVGLGSLGDSSARKQLFDKAIAAGLEPIQSIHPSAVISPSSVLGRGSTIMAGVVLNASVTLGDNVIVNTRSVVDHDCWLGDHVHVATGAILSGGVRVEAGAHIGAGAVIRQHVNIGKEAIIGAGAAVVKDVPAHQIVAGVPARPLQRLK
jgi:sugar O-acyltransferase (sialic acid O-acetyltransferase NeuD family)